MSLNYIHPDNIHSVWDFVKEGLQRIHDRAKDRWKPEDIYAQIKFQNYLLYIVNNNEGFVILQPTKGWDGAELFVFGAYIVPGHDVMDEAFEEVKKIARSAGARRIKFQTKRRGWDKRAEQLGYRESLKEYEMELT